MQSKRHSLMEAVISTAVGFVLAIVIQHYLYIWYDIKVTHSQNFQIVAILTVVSVLRGYWLRRLFNWLHMRATIKTAGKAWANSFEELLDRMKATQDILTKAELDALLHVGAYKYNRRFDPSFTYLCPDHLNPGFILDMQATEFMCNASNSMCHTYTIDEAIVEVPQSTDCDDRQS